MKFTLDMTVTTIISQFNNNMKEVVVVHLVCIFKKYFNINNIILYIFNQQSITFAFFTESTKQKTSKIFQVSTLLPIYTSEGGSKYFETDWHCSLVFNIWILLRMHCSTRSAPITKRLSVARNRQWSGYIHHVLGTLSSSLDHWKSIRTDQ